MTKLSPVYDAILKNWSTDKMGPVPTTANFEHAHKCGFTPGSNNAVVTAMGLRPKGFTRPQMLAYCKPCLNSRNEAIQAGTLKDRPMPSVKGQGRVYAVSFVKAKVKAKRAAPVAKAGKGKGKRKGKGKAKRTSK